MTITKLIIVVGGAGLATSVALGTSFYLTADFTIEQLLNKENPKQVSLKTGLNKQEWVAKWKDYITNNRTESNLNQEDTWKIDKWATVGKIENTVPDEFAKKCEEKLSNKVSGTKDPKYIEFIRFCVK